MTDFRALCAELTEQLHQYAEVFPEHNMDALVKRARTALAEPKAELLQQQVMVPVSVSDALIKAECALSDIAEGEPMTDEGDPLQWAERRCADTLAIIRPTMRQHKIRTSEWPPLPLPSGEPSDQELYDYWIATSPELGCADPVGFARAVLARWGCPAPVPAEGEVAELVAEMRRICFDVAPCSAETIHRAAGLLERLASPACVVLKPSPELIEAFQDALPGRIELLPDDAQAPVPVAMAERLPEVK